MRNLVVIFCLAALTGCVSHEIALRADSTAVMPERKTAGLSVMDATRIAILDAARLTVDHGGRYFRILRAGQSGQGAGVRPGADVVVQVIADGDSRAGMVGVWDAQKILIEGVPQSALSAITVAPGGAMPRRQAPPQPGTPPAATPRCTAYGCVW